MYDCDDFIQESWSSVLWSVHLFSLHPVNIYSRLMCATTGDAVEVIVFYSQVIVLMSHKCEIFFHYHHICPLSSCHRGSSFTSPTSFSVVAQGAAARCAHSEWKASATTAVLDFGGGSRRNFNALYSQCLNAGTGNCANLVTMLRMCLGLHG